jgi:hypothetical protein
MEEKIAITGALRKATANRFFQQIRAYKDQEIPKWGDGWLNRFKKRHGIKQHIQHGESSDVNKAAIAAQLVSLQYLFLFISN